MRTLRRSSRARASLRDLSHRALARIVVAVTRNGRYHEADSLLDRWVAFATGAQDEPGASEQSDPAVTFWDAALVAAPDQPICRARLAAALRRSGQLDRAREIIEAAVALHPDDLGVTLEAARVADRRSDFAVARAHWEKATATFRPRPSWQAGAAHALMMLGRFDAADAVLAPALRAHPRHRGLLAVECMLASARGDWSRAVDLATAFNRRFPKHPDGWFIAGQAVEGAKRQRLFERNKALAEVEVPADVGRAKDEEACRLLLGFASLGENCEFGLVQRRFEAEPLDLLRWNIVYSEDLVAALDHRLEGLGEPEHTELTVLANGEYFVHDDRWYLGMHTFLREGQASREDLYPAVCLRIAALKATFFADLAAAERIFVYSAPGLTFDEVAGIHRALRVYGPNRFLAVQLAEPPASSPFRGRAGDIVVVEPGLYVGFLRRMGIGPDGRWNIAFDDWIAVCRKAAAAAAGEQPGSSRQRAGAR